MKRSAQDRDEDRLPGHHQAAAGGRRTRDCAWRTTTSRFAPASSKPRPRRKNAFKDSTVYIEKYVEFGRHVEVQVIADMHGNAVHLWERDCTMQRRHQKLVEESPSPGAHVQDSRRALRRRRAIDQGRQVLQTPARWSSSSTKKLNYYILEVNARIQVEHPVDGTGHRHRFDQGTNPRRQRREAELPLKKTYNSAATPSSAASTPKTPPRNFTPSTGFDRRIPRPPAAPACGSIATPTPATASRPITTA